MSGLHRAYDEDESGGWLYHRPPDDPGGDHIGPRVPPWIPPRPPGLPVDRYGEDRTTGSTPRVRPDDTWVELPPLAQGRASVPRPPPPVQAPRPTQAPPPAEPISRAVRAQDAIREWALIVAVIAAAVSLVVAGLVTSVRDHQRMRVISEQNQDLRQVQIEQQRRLAAAEQQAADAKAAAGEAQQQLEDLRQRVDQLDTTESQTSGS